MVVRVFSFADEARPGKFWNIPREQFAERTVELQRRRLLTHIDSASEQQLEQILDIANRNGAKFHSIGSRVGKYNVGASDVIAKTDKWIEGTIRSAEILRVNEVRVFNFWPNDKDGNPITDKNELNEAYQRAIEFGKAIVSTFWEYGIRVGFEPEKGLFGQTGEQLADYLTAVGFGAFAYWDGANVVRVSGNDTAEVARKVRASYEALKPFLIGVHVKDCMTLKPGEAESKHTYVGQGDAQYGAVFRDLARGTLEEINQRRVSLGLARETPMIAEPHKEWPGPSGGVSNRKFTPALVKITEECDKASLPYLQNRIKYRKAA